MAVIEVQVFRLIEGVSEEVFLEHDRAVQTEFVPNLPGFQRRTTARGSDGDWLVITLWSDSDSVEHSRRVAGFSPVVGRYVACVETATVRTKLFATLD